MTDIFIAYSHEDLAYKNELKKFLQPLLRERRISVWDDFDIEAGQEWDAKIKERLYSAGVILLLISSDSLASDYFYGKEVQVSLERHKKGEAVVVPVILRHCDWENTPLGELEALPGKGRPVVEWRDQAWQDTVNRLRRVVDNIDKSRESVSALTSELKRYQFAVQSATQLYDRRQWVEALKASLDALTLYQQGFSPDRRLIEQQIARCNKELQLIEGPSANPNHLKNQVLFSGTRHPIIRRVILLGVVGTSFSLLVWLQLCNVVTDPIKDDYNSDKHELKQFQNAVDAQTIPALDSFIVHYPTSKNITSAKQKLAELKSRYFALINDAELLKTDSIKITCSKLNKALALMPGDTLVLGMKKKLNCQ